MQITRVSPDYSASPQITPDDVAEIAALGFRSIMSNRPDGESADQTEAAAIRAEAERLGLAFSHVPVVSGAITEADLADFTAALADLPSPVLSYCRSGARSQNLWLLSRG